MSVKLKVDTSDFQKTLREYMYWNRREEAEIVNKIAKDVALYASKFTPKAVREKIREQVTRDNLGFKIIAKRKGKPGFDQKEMKVAARKMLNARLRSVGYVAAGWFKALADLGVKTRYNPKSKIREGYAYPAQPKKVAEAVIANAVAGAGKIGSEALQEAIRFKTADMKKYIERKMAEAKGRFFK